MTTVYLGLGSNLGERRALMDAALKQIDERCGRVTALSSFVETEAWGYRSDNRFLNAVACIETPLSVQQLLHETQAIERELGRQHKSGGPVGSTTQLGTYADRTMDIDILFYGDELIEMPELTVPHPLLHQRRFVLQPLTEIAPNWRHPKLCQTMRQLLHALPHDAR